MKKPPLIWLQAYFVLSLLIFGMVQLLKYFSADAPDWVFFYLNDFITIPLVLTVCLYGIRFLKKDRTIRLGVLSISSMVTLYSIYFEFYLPSISDRYTGDMLDVLCYLAGGIIFYFLQKPTLKLKEPRTT